MSVLRGTDTTHAGIRGRYRATPKESTFGTLIRSFAKTPVKRKTMPCDIPSAWCQAGIHTRQNVQVYCTTCPNPTTTSTGTSQAAQLSGSSKLNPAEPHGRSLSYWLPRLLIRHYPRESSPFTASPPPCVRKAVVLFLATMEAWTHTVEWDFRADSVPIGN